MNRWWRHLADWIVPDRTLRWGTPTRNDIETVRHASGDQRHIGWTPDDFHAASNTTQPRCPTHGTLGGGVTFCRYRVDATSWCGQPLQAPAGGPPYRIHVSRRALTESQNGVIRPPIVVRSTLANGGETIGHFHTITIRCPNCGTPAAVTRTDLNATDGVLVWIACDAIDH